MSVKLGDKQRCNGCGARFYDLGRNLVICPKCGEQTRCASASIAAAGNAYALTDADRDDSENIVEDVETELNDGLLAVGDHIKSFAVGHDE